MPVRSLLQIAERLKIDPTYFFKENDYAIGLDQLESGNEFSAGQDAVVRELFKGLLSSVDFLLNETDKKALEKLSKIQFDRVEYSASARSHLGITQHSFLLTEHASLDVQAIKLGHEFMLQNSDRVIVRYCNHLFGSFGRIDTVNVARGAKDSVDSFYSYLIPHKVGQLSAKNPHLVDELLAGLKYFYQDRVLVLKSSRKTASLPLQNV